MDFQDKQYVIGIDLGTTNSAVSYVDLVSLQEKKNAQKACEKKPFLKVFKIPQLTGHGEFTKKSVLPSFLYIPGEYDISKEALKHPWKKREDLFAGRFARDHGAKVPSRLVCSAKSWLCNPAADRKSKILPWGSQGVDKVSPVIATSEYLSHIRSAWNHFVRDEDKFLENQFVVITVPASFNEEARELTMEAVKIAGFGSSVVLLEEPLAAFYAWLINHETDWQKYVNNDDLIFVCDVGGGTTDFSLISLKATGGTPRFERIAVGEHLILGGDNIDQALAQTVESKFKSKTKLSADKWKTLCHTCRQLKENILEKGKLSSRVTLKGEGRSLIAGTLSADLTIQDIETILIETFFPDVEKKDLNQMDTGKKITEFGLPFEKESSITTHIIAFLERHRADVQKCLSKDPVPDFILFNGGTLKPELVQNRIVGSIKKWFGIESQPGPIILENKSPELAVGIGASYYGLVKQGEGVRVGSGSPRSYFLGISMGQARQSKAVCLVERGLDEGSVINLPQMAYEVRANEPVSFNMYGSSYRSGDIAGDIIDIDSSVTSLPPLQTIIKFGKKSEEKRIPVTIGAEYTEMGSLAIYCQSGVSEHKWKLQFQLRDDVSGTAAPDAEVYDEALVLKSCAFIKEAFTDPKDKSENLDRVVKHIEYIVEQKKSGWPLSFLRTMADELIKIGDFRGNSPEHETRWLNLTGFCMRPGFGDTFDEERIRYLWRIYLSGLKFKKVKQNRIEWWIFIRRIAAGLKAGQQRQFFQDASAVLKGRHNKTRLSPQEQVELWMTAGNMERLLVKDKVALSKTLLPQLKPGKKQDTLFWVLSRLGARELLYGSNDRVIPSKEVMKWIRRIFKTAWKKSDPVENMVVQLVRRTGDRTRDIEQEEVLTVERWLKDRNVDKALIKKVNTRVKMALKEKNTQFGEKLPFGLVLKK